MGIQQLAFSKELELIRNGQELPQKSALIALNPFVDSIGLLRAGGRLAQATNANYDFRFPKLLPKGEQNVAALIREEHTKQGHAGTNYIWSSLSKTYWITHGRQMVKSVINGCVQCQKNFKQPGHQMMADLPTDRVDGYAPFEATAIDAFGPVAVKNGGRGFHKRWVLLFTCLSCRGVHFELLRDLSSSTFINALVRFHGRRPGLRVLYSDQATNF